MSSAAVTPGYRWTDPDDPITTSKLNATAQPVVTIPANSIGTAELIAADVQALFPGALSNRVINGNFDVWQRGGFANSSGLPTVLGATTDVTDIWGADHWGIGLANGAGKREVYRENFVPGQQQVPNEPHYFLRWNQTTNQANQRLTQAIEDVRTFADQDITVSFWVRSSQSVTIGVRMGQNWGGVSPPATSYTNTQNVALTAGNVWTQVVKNFSMPSVAGETIGATGSALSVEIMMPNSTWQIDVAQVQVVLGTFDEDNITAFDVQTYREELRQCMRYFEYTAGVAFKVITDQQPTFYFTERKYADVVLMLLAGYTGTGMAFTPLFDVGYYQTVANSAVSAFFIQAESEIFINPA